MERGLPVASSHQFEHGDARDPVMSRSESEHAPAPRQWHRLFGIALTDLFSGTPWRVELEKELALQSQLLDVVIIEQAPAPEGVMTVYRRATAGPRACCTSCI
jgi:hypothetical protein